MFMGPYILKLLECSHQDKVIIFMRVLRSLIVVKTSIQDLVKGIVAECAAHLSEEGLCTDALPLDEFEFTCTVSAFDNDIRGSVEDASLLERSKLATALRFTKLERIYDSTVRILYYGFSW